MFGALVTSDTPTLSVDGRINRMTLTDIWHHDDEWSGLTSTAERKKRQNRINQRKWRRRHAVQRESRSEPLGRSGLSFVETPIEGLKQLLSHNSSPGGNDSRVLLEALADGPTLLNPSWAALARERIRQAYEDYSLGGRGRTSLSVLIRLNLLNAMHRNAQLQGFQSEGLCSHAYISPYLNEGPRLPQHLDLQAACPGNLGPTVLQRTVRHYPWVDLFPFPRFRDNVLQALSTVMLGEEELCYHLLELEHEDPDDRLALVVWGEASDCRNWEASPSFLRKWSWLVHDCPEIIESTNYWRERRGEQRLVQEIS